MKPIKYPVKALRSWEGYGIEPDDDDREEYMARPFTRIEDADGDTVITAHDCFEFKPGQAERIVACLNYCAGVENLEIGLVPRAEYDAKERYWIEHANGIAKQRDELLDVMRDVAHLLPVAGRLHPKDLHALQTRVVQCIHPTEVGS